MVVVLLASFKTNQPVYQLTNTSHRRTTNEIWCSLPFKTKRQGSTGVALNGIPAWFGAFPGFWVGESTFKFRESTGSWGNRAPRNRFLGFLLVGYSYVCQNYEGNPEIVASVFLLVPQIIFEQRTSKKKQNTRTAMGGSPCEPKTHTTPSHQLGDIYLKSTSKQTPIWVCRFWRLPSKIRVLLFPTKQQVPAPPTRPHSNTRPFAGLLKRWILPI